MKFEGLKKGDRFMLADQNDSSLVLMKTEPVWVGINLPYYDTICLSDATFSTTQPQTEVKKIA